MPIGGNNPYYPPGVMSHAPPPPYQERDPQRNTSQPASGASGARYSSSSSNEHSLPSYESLDSKKKGDALPSFSETCGNLKEPDQRLQLNSYQRAVNDTSSTKKIYQTLESYAQDPKSGLTAADTLKARNAVEKYHNAHASGSTERSSRNNPFSSFFGGSSHQKLKDNMDKEISKLVSKVGSQLDNTHLGDPSYMTKLRINAELDELNGNRR